MNLSILKIFFFSLLISALNHSFAQGYLHTSGKYIHDGDGNELILRGIGTGNWLLNEGYMMKTADFAGTHTQFRTLLTETIGEENTEIYYQHWLDNHFTRHDVDSMKNWGFNSVRVAMHYKWFTLPIEQEPVTGQDTWFEEGFTRIDSLLDWCGDNQMYLILDLHGAPGGQGHDRNISDYDPDFPSLWESAENRRKTAALWKRLAERYAEEPWIGGYDLINEPNWDIPGGSLLRQTYITITSAIREVDTNHMIIIEGNWFANDYTGLTPPWDDNMVFSFHKYWNYNTQESIQWMINLRNTYNVPIWLGETGENSNSWFADLVELAENNKIGWSWWPVKKAGINNVLMVPESPLYNLLLSFWENGSPALTQQQAFEAVLDWAENHKIENCTVQRDVIDALLRQPHENSALPFRDHQVSQVINMVDYDLGKCSVAYWDTDTANYHLNTGSFTDWNRGWAYRNDGVDIEPCQDDFPGTNGYGIGFTAAGEWLQYTVASDTAAAYKMVIRSASESNPGSVHLTVNGIDASPSIQMPVTYGWQNWLPAIAENIIIPAGINQIRVCFDKGGSNYSLLQFSDPAPVAGVPFQFVAGTTNPDGSALIITLNKDITGFDADISDFDVLADEVPVTVNAAMVSTSSNRKLILYLADKLRFGQTVTLSYSGAGIMAGDQALETFTGKPVKNTLPHRYLLPALIQAEDYIVNSGYQLENCTDINGGQNIGYANNGDYLDYFVSVPQAGEYIFRLRAASLYSNGSISLRLGDGSSFTSLKTINITQTGGWQNWITLPVTIDLPQGDFTLRILSLSGEYNINWFEISLPAGENQYGPIRRFQVFPNPSDGKIRVEADFAGNSGARLKIFSSNGKIIYNRDFTETYDFSQNIDLAYANPGIYFLCLTTASGSSFTRKVIIN